MSVRIVDIARMAGVSPGTVDRVLHNRGHVSEDKRTKVEKVLKKINYEPNMIARSLASKRNYKFAAIIPIYSPGDYWELVCDGINKATNELKSFNVTTQYLQFNQFDRDSFPEIAHSIKDGEFDGVLIAPLFRDHSITLSAQLDADSIPYIYIDSAIPQQNQLSAFGGDSFHSGNIAAKLLSKEVGLDADIMIVHVKYKHKEISVQMKSREQGFLDYLATNNFSGCIHQFELDTSNLPQSKSSLEAILNKSTKWVGGIVLNSRIYELVSLLNKIDASLSNKVRLVGYDAIERNVKALKTGDVSFIISQRPDLQGYDAIKTLANYFVFKQTPAPTNNMPIDILVKENIDYYNNYKL